MLNKRLGLKRYEQVRFGRKGINRRGKTDWLPNKVGPGILTLIMQN